MKFKDIPIGDTFTKGGSIFMKIQEVVPKLEKIEVQLMGILFASIPYVSVDRIVRTGF